MKTFSENYQELLKKAYQVLDRKTKRKDFEVKTVSFDLKISYKNNKLDSIKDKEYNLFVDNLNVGSYLVYDIDENKMDVEED